MWKNLIKFCSSLICKMTPSLQLGCVIVLNQVWSGGNHEKFSQLIPPVLIEYQDCHYCSLNGTHIGQKVFFKVIISSLNFQWFNYFYRFLSDIRHMLVKKLKRRVSKYEKIVNVLAPTIMVLKQSRVTNFIISELSNIHISV